MASKKVLVVDDEVGIRELLLDILQDEGYQVKLADNAATAREMRMHERPDVVLLDIWMPDCDGITLLKEWGASGLLTMPVVMMSGHGTIDTAVEATRIGAFDFLEKPIALKKLLKTVSLAIKQSETQPKSNLSLISLGKNPIVVAVKERLEKIMQASTANPVLFIGPEGACGELCARYLHTPNKPWLMLLDRQPLVNAPIELLESVAEGVLYVPEVTELTKLEQKGLLLLLRKAETFHARVVCSTSKNLPKMKNDGLFEPTLFQLLSNITVRLPALDEHKEDIPDLVITIANMQFAKGDFEYKEFDVAALNALRNTSWPGDFMQLESAVRNLILTSLEDKITLQDVNRVLYQFDETVQQLQPLTTDQSDQVLVESGKKVFKLEPPSDSNLFKITFPDLDQPLREARDAFERLYFEYHLKETTSNMSKLAERAGLERTHLYRKLKQLGLKGKL